MQEKLAKLSTFSQEVFSGIKIIKTFNMQEIVTENFDDLSKSSKSQVLACLRFKLYFFH